MKRSISALAVLTPLLLVITALSGGAQADVFGAKRTVLDNGLEVVVVENHRAPVVTQMLWYKVGAMDEPPGKSGIAHFLEHLMFKGTKTVAPGEFSRTVQRHGGRDNAFTSQDATGYYQSVASDRLELIMRMEADRMRNLVLTEDVFTPEKSVILEERASRTDGNPSALLSEQVNAGLYLNHPYRIPIIGWRHEIEGLTLEDALDFYKRYYAPNNAVLVIAGDVEADDAFRLAEKYYGVIEPSDLPERPRYSEPPHLGDKLFAYRHDQVREPSWSLRKLAPSHNVGASEHVYPLQVLMNILGGGNTSRLYRSLVIDQGIAVTAGGWYDGGARGPGMVGFWARPVPGKSLDDVKAAINAEVAKLVRDGASDDEVARAIARLQDSAATAMDSLSGPARVIGEALSTGLDLAEVEAWPERIGAVTVEQVNTAAREVLTKPGGVEAHLLPPRAPAGEGDKS